MTTERLCYGLRQVAKSIRPIQDDAVVCEIEGEGGAFVRNEQRCARGDGVSDPQLVEDIRIGNADVREGDLRREDLAEDLVTDEAGLRDRVDPHRRPARVLASRADAFSVDTIEGNGATRRMWGFLGTEWADDE